MRQSYHYRLFGLRIQSELPLPELLEATHITEPDVLIRMDAVPAPSQARPGLHRGPNGDAVLLVPDVGRYRIAAGREIVVEPDSGVPERNVRLFLLGSAMGMLLHQRGLLPLHANAVEIEGKAVAFMGASGAGKSTLAAWFHDRGHRILSDDVCVVGFDDHGQPQVQPGIGRLRLWSKALALTGRAARDFEPSFDRAPGKFDVPVDQEFEDHESLRLGAVYVLDQDEDFGVDRLVGIKAVEAVFANTYRGGYVERVGSSKDHWQASVELARTTPIFQIRRTWGLDKLDTSSSELLRHAQQMVQST